MTGEGARAVGMCSGGGTLTAGPAAEGRAQECGEKGGGLVGRADIGAGRDDFVDPVEDVVGELDLDAPTLASLLEAAAADGAIRADISSKDLLYAVANLCLPVADEGLAYSRRMVALLVDGLRYGAGRRHR